MTDEGKERFKTFLTNVNWESIMIDTVCPSESTSILQEKLEKLNDMCFPWKTQKIRSTDHPWITDNVRRGIRRRRRRYKKHKRDDRWKNIKQEIVSEIKTNKKEYYQKEASKAGSSARIPYKILHHMSDPDRKPAWSVNHLCPGWSEEEMSEDLASYFSRITDGFIPLDCGDLPVTYSSPVAPVAPHEVADRIRCGKKPLTAVYGDPIPCMLNVTADILAIPTTRIINLAFNCLTWPAPWKVETQSVIPKTSTPRSSEEIRNISCTNYMSKIMESFVLDRLRDEVSVKSNQYSGTKGTGTTHFLIDTYQRILDCLDDGLSCVSLIAIDFSKASTGCATMCV